MPEPKVEPEEKPEVKPEEKPEVKPERVPEYVERHELKTMLDEMRALFTDRTSKDEAHFAALEASLTDARKPKPEKPEVNHDEKPIEKPEEKPQSKSGKVRLWRYLR